MLAAHNKLGASRRCEAHIQICYSTWFKSITICEAHIQICENTRSSSPMSPMSLNSERTVMRTPWLFKASWSFASMPCDKASESKCAPAVASRSSGSKSSKWMWSGSPKSCTVEAVLAALRAVRFTPPRIPWRRCTWPQCQPCKLKPKSHRIMKV